MVVKKGTNGMMIITVFSLRAQNLNRSQHSGTSLKIKPGIPPRLIQKKDLMEGVDRLNDTSKESDGTKSETED